MNEKYNVIVTHYHEVGLKGKNRSFFERALADNIRHALAGTNYDRVRPISGRILVGLNEDSDFEAITEGLAKVFGLSHFSPAVRLKADLGAVTTTALELAKAATFESFAVRARRGHSSFEPTSQDVNVAVGQALMDATNSRVDLDNPDWTCHIEFVEDSALVYSERLEAPGGLPVGSSGKSLALLSGGIDSPVAAWRVARRGSQVDLIHFHGQPFSDASSVRQATRLAHQLRPWLVKPVLWIIPFGEIQSEIVTSAEEPLRIVLYRRFMMRIAERVAADNGHGALVTGESLGQVASQTLPNIAAIGSAVTLPIFRPLIGFDKLEIEAEAKRIGTYEISTEPHQDCCVLFVPRRVSTKARPSDVARAEAGLDVNSLVEKGVANASVVEL